MMPEEVKPETTPTAEKSQEVKQTKPPAAEKQTNCLGCGKPIKKLKRYYRDGNFYCSKKCWRKSVKSKETKNA